MDPRWLRCRRLWPGRGPAVLEHVALGIAGGRIVSVEPSAPTDDAAPFVMPAFVDAHWHMLWAGHEGTSLLLEEASSREELLERVRQRVSVDDGDDILRGEKLDESTWPDPRLPTLAELDRVTGVRPVFLRRVCGHVALANSALLRRLPADVASEGRESGRLTERPVLDFDRWFPRSVDDSRRALAHATSVALDHGVTAVCTMEPLANARVLAATAAGLELRYAVFGDDFDELEAWLDDEAEPCRGASGDDDSGATARLLGVKLFLDGAIGASTAALACGFADGSSGALLYDDQQLERLLVRIVTRGLVPVVHAIGARALRQLARTSKRLVARVPAARAIGIRVEHAEELEPTWSDGWDAGLHRFSMQPNFVRRWQGAGGLYEQRMAVAAARRLNPFALVRRAGFALGFGSDGMPFGPLWGLLGAIDHPEPSFALAPHEAFEAYTLGAAAMCGLPELATPLAPGRQADLLILSDDPLRGCALDSLAILGVMRRGELLRGAPELLSRAPRSGARPAGR